MLSSNHKVATYSEDALIVIFKFIKFIFSRKPDEFLEFTSKPVYSLFKPNSCEEEFKKLQKDMYPLFLNMSDKDVFKEYKILAEKSTKMIESAQRDINFDFVFNNNKYNISIYENTLENTLSFSFHLANDEYYTDRSTALLGSFFNNSKFAAVSDDFLDFISNFDDLNEELKPQITNLNNNQFFDYKHIYEEATSKFEEWKTFLNKKKRLGKEGKPYVYNDLDNNAYYKENENYQMIVHEDQTLIFAHIFEPSTGVFKIFECCHLKTDENVDFDANYFFNNFDNCSKYLAFDSRKGLNIKCKMAFFVKEHLSLLRYGLIK